MKLSAHTSTRDGFSLMEVIVSLSAASVLTIGLSSSMYIALRATDRSNSPAANTLEGIDRLSNMAAELEYALTMTEQTATAITVTVPDRNDPDSNPETIRYAWSGSAGDPLTREYNGGSAKTVVDDVHAFSIRYFQPGTAVEYLTIAIQVTSNTGSNTETAIPLLNRP